MSTQSGHPAGPIPASAPACPDGPASPEAPASKQLIVHLVHGTWPNGPFKKVDRSATDVWYAHESEICRQIVNGADRTVQLKQFFWSGNNTFSARRQAAAEFTRHLNTSLEADAGSDHVVLAHSHGGTVAMHAIYRMADFQRYPDHPLKAVICMASPFAYVTRATEKQRELAGDAISILLTAAIVTAALLVFPEVLDIPWALLWFLAAWIVCGFFCNVAVQIWLFMNRPATLHFDLPEPEKNLPFYLIRATRDEAALAIGLAQGLNAFFAKIFFATEPDASQRDLRLKRNILSGLVSPLAGLPFAIPVLVIGLLLHWKLPVIAIAMLLFSSIAWPLLAILSYTALCISVGMFKFRLWGQVVVEVDGAPPNNDSHFISIADTDSLNSLGVRHGIYLLPEVHKAIVKIIHSLR